jgi:hypothetical protein
MNASLASSREFDRNGTADASPLSSAAIKIFVAVLIGIGLLARFAPFIDIDGRLFWQYMTEDGYLMQTIARNMAIGLGMTTADGTMATNGVQPLATFIFTGLHFLAGGSKSAGVVLVSLASILFSVGAAYFLYRAAALVLRVLPYGVELARVAAALWFAAPLIIPISMNGLETSLYWAVLLGTLWYYLALTIEPAPLRSAQRILLGVLLGLTFLSRNDAVFFIAIVLLVHLITGGATEAGGYARRLVDCVAAGVTSIVVATPWLIYNYRLFGSIVPISGTAQSYSTALGSNLTLIPAKLFEASTLYLPLPGRFEQTIPTMIAALGLIALTSYVFWLQVGRAHGAGRRFLAIAIGLVVCLGGYYGIMFGAPHFLARYLSILSPFLWLLTSVTMMYVIVKALKAGAQLRYATAGIVGVLTLAAAAFAGSTFVRGYSQGTAHMHQQVIEWVAANVPEKAWVGAPQTGVLGYFHDRTLNLDGKVNPEALRVLLEEGHILNYVLTTQVDYIVDWVGMADWVKRSDLSPEFGREFVVVARDEERNLAALKRVHLHDAE